MAILGGIGGGMGSLVSSSLFKSYDWWSVAIIFLGALIAMVVAMDLFLPLLPRETQEITERS